jgi:hypothetical protein
VFGYEGYVWGRQGGEEGIPLGRGSWLVAVCNVNGIPSPLSFLLVTRNSVGMASTDVIKWRLNTASSPDSLPGILRNLSTLGDCPAQRVAGVVVHRSPPRRRCETRPTFALSLGIYIETVSVNG